MNELAQYFEKCNRCGFCMEVCPTYPLGYMEWRCPRGRVALVDGMVSGKVTLQDAAQAVNDCLLCGRCEAACPSGVQITRVIEGFRQVANEEHQPCLPWVAATAITNFLPRPGLMDGARVAGAAVLRSRFKQLLEGNRGLIGRAASTFADLPVKSARHLLSDKSQFLSNRQGRVLYFLGCMADQALPKVAQATVNLLTKLGFEVVIPDVRCCGMPAKMYGFTAQALRLAEHNMRVLTLAGDYDAVISDCPTCVSALQNYAVWLKDGPWGETAETLAQKTWEIGSFVAKVGESAITGTGLGAVSYHYPCHLKHGLNHLADPLALLRSWGAEVRNDQSVTECCGGAGAYFLVHPDLSDLILSKKIDALLSEGTGEVVTSCPSCMLQLGRGFRQRQANLRVSHVAEILNEALEGGERKRR